MDTALYAKSSIYNFLFQMKYNFGDIHTHQANVRYTIKQSVREG